MSTRSAALFILAVAVVFVLRPFLNALVWTSVISIVAWPLNRYLRRAIPHCSKSVAAGVMTVLVVALMLGIIIPLFSQVAAETRQLIAAVREWVADGSRALPASLARFEWLRDYFEMPADQTSGSSQTIAHLLDEYQAQILSMVSFAARNVWGFLFDLVMMIFSTYFFFRHGDTFARQIFTAAERLGGTYFLGLAHTAWATIHAVVFGVVGAAISQGILAGIGYYACDVPLPFLMAVLTAILGLVPAGPPILYLSLALLLFLRGAPWYTAVALAAWGVAVVSTADNLVRTFLITHTTKLPILLAFFGGLGGIAAFGMVGLFIGPVALALAYNVWLTIGTEVSRPPNFQADEC